VSLWERLYKPMPGHALGIPAPAPPDIVKKKPERDIAAEVRETLRLEDPARLSPSEAVDRGETTVKPYRQVRVTKER